MSGRASDPTDHRLQGFKAGVNNVAPRTKPPRDEFGTVLSVAEAVNVDFDPVGRARRRRGQVVEDPRPSHSGISFGPGLLIHVDTAIHQFSDLGIGLQDEGVVVAGVGVRPVSFTSDDYDVYWSNGAAIGRITENLDALPVWVETPDPAEASPIASGGLAAGQYEVSVSVIDADGRESGGSAPTVVTVAAGGGISLAFPTAPPDATKWLVYVSGADGDVLYWQGEYPIARTSATIAGGPRGDAQPTAWLYPFPACETLRYAHGRLYGLAGNVLWWSEPYRLGLVHADNHMVLGNEATLLEPMETGVFVADHKRTYWLDGTNPDEWRQRVAYPHAAAPGGSAVLAASVFRSETGGPVAVWLAANGVLCMGSEGGSVRALRDDAIAFPAGAERAALGFFEFDGIRQLVMSTMGGGTNFRAAAGDSVDVQIRRNGVVLP